MRRVAVASEGRRNSSAVQSHHLRKDLLGTQCASNLMATENRALALVGLFLRRYHYVFKKNLAKRLWKMEVKHPLKT